MLPKNFKSMFGITNEADLKMADNIWKMLDDMSSNDPEAYEKFIQKNLSEGLEDAKQQKSKQDQPYKITPIEYMLLEMQGQLEQQQLCSDSNAPLKQKLDLNLNKDKWCDVKAKHSPRVRIFLNICHSDRVKSVTLKSKSGVQVNNFQVAMMKDIQCLYYSLQGPEFDSQSPPVVSLKTMYYVAIFNSNFLKAFDLAPNDKRMFLGIAVAYFQQRIKGDRNPVLSSVDTRSLYGKQLYYRIQKESVKISQSTKFKYGKSEKVGKFLLEQDVDTQSRQKKLKAQRTSVSNQPVAIRKQPQINIIKKQIESEYLMKGTSTCSETSKSKSLVPLIQQIGQKQDEMGCSLNINNISYEMKQNQIGCLIRFMLPPRIKSIEQLDLEVSSNLLKLSIQTQILADKKSTEIVLAKLVDKEKVKAKLKKKTHTLQVEVNYLI